MRNFFSGRRSFWKAFVLTLIVCVLIIVYQLRHYTTSPFDAYFLQLSSEAAKHHLYGLIRNALIAICLTLSIAVGLLWWHPRKKLPLPWNIVIDVMIVVLALLVIYLACLWTSYAIQHLIQQMSNALPTELLHHYLKGI